MIKLKALENPRWEKFVQSLVKGKSQRQAYRDAFPRSKRWKDETVDTHASRLRNQNGKVVARYNELTEKAADESVISSIKRKQTLTEFIKNEDLSPNDRMKAIDLLNKMDGTYINNVQLSGTINTNLRPLENIDDAKLDEVAKRLSGDDGT